jgi:hypothetical protein
LNLLAREMLFFQTAPVVVARENGEKFRIATGIEAYEVNIPTWPESRYLARIANKKPSEVFEIINKCKVSNDPNERNVSVIRDFVDAANNMSDEYAYKMVSLFIKRKWFGVDIVIDQKLVELISNLTIKRNKISYAILDTLLDVTEDKRYIPIPLHLNPSGKPQFENYIRSAIYHFSYMKILNEIIPSLKDKAPFLIVDILTKKLSKAIYLDSKINKERGNESTRSDLWRPTVETNRPTDDDIDIKSVLVTSLRNSLRDVLATKDRRLIRECMNRISKEQSKIFRRIELYCYQIHPDFFNPEIRNAVFTYLDDIEVFHEYYHLLESVFKKLPKTVQKRYLQIIEKGPKKSVVRSWESIAKGQRANDQLKNNKKRWKVLKLEPIEAYLPSKTKKSYNKMLQEVGKQSFGGSLFYSRVTTYDPEDSSGSQLSEGMKPEEVMNFIQTYELIKDKADMLYDPNIIRFEELVSKGPFAYSQQSLRLVDAHPTYFYKFFRGLNKALEKKETGVAPQSFDWNAILELCEQFITTDRLRKNSSFLYDIFHPVTLFILKAIKDNLPPFTYRRRLWRVIYGLVSYCTATTSWDASYPTGIMNSHSIVLNSTKGLALAAAIEYAIWCNRNLKTEGKNKNILVDELKAILAEHLNTNNSSIATHATLGAYIPLFFQIDKKWTQDNLPNFLNENVGEKLFLAAWDSYLYHHGHRAPPEYMLHYYTMYIRRFKSYKEEHERINNMLIEQITTAYVLDSKLGDRLFDFMISNFNPKFANHLIKFVGEKLLGQYKLNRDLHINLDKIKQLWEDQRFIDFKEFGWWYINSPFNKRYSISRLLSSLKNTNGRIDPPGTVSEMLVSYSIGFPLQTLKCLKLILNAYRNDPLERDYLRNNAYKAILNIKIHVYPRVLSESHSVIDFFGSLGFHEFKDLR